VSILLLGASTNKRERAFVIPPRILFSRAVVQSNSVYLRLPWVEVVDAEHDRTRTLLTGRPARRRESIVTLGVRNCF
jgi:hypothetical protein